MQNTLKSLLLMLRTGDEQARSLGQEIADWLERRGLRATLCEHRVDGGLEACKAPEDAPWDLVLVLGGDGTFIGVARVCLHLGLPLLGLNLGRVGFLAEGADKWPKRLEALQSGRYVLSRRVCLGYAVSRGAATVCSGIAVNDVVVSRGDMARLIRLKVERESANGLERVGEMRADGLIVSTPTGSTAYGYSAGGPLVYPELAALCLTPVCPFLNTFGPMVLPADAPLRIAVEEPRGEVRMTVDGQRAFALEHGDVVRLVRCPDDLLMAQTAECGSYFAKLANKGFFTQR
ncbi:NAD+ kinase [Humidesulfovibrio mexicanus]|uniref:NAD kinase n=1 Tax=Humidesulfovibrio mexicanus TaxID=147047 RepID=A0A238Y001_9BACT|nr:NAD+ kinase [Humidesulfovibrio mexicanus]